MNPMCIEVRNHAHAKQNNEMFLIERLNLKCLLFEELAKNTGMRNEQKTNK